MTVKEAIKRLRLMADGGTNFSKESNEACRMGAEALKEIEKRGSVNCGQLCEWNTTAGCEKPNGVPCKMSNVTVAKKRNSCRCSPCGAWRVDCKHFLTEKLLCTHEGNMVFNTGKTTYPNCFCSYGEQKEN